MRFKKLIIDIISNLIFVLICAGIIIIMLVGVIIIKDLYNLLDKII